MTQKFSDCSSINQYLRDIRNTNPYNRKDEQGLFVLFKNGNRRARAKILSANMRFVLKVALQYQNCNVPLQDLVSEGAMGLIRAMESFDHTRGLKFISYAVWWIKAYITRAIVKHSSLIRLPANQRLKIIRALKSGKKRENLTDEIQKLIRLGQKGSSIHAPVWEGSKATFCDILPDEKTLLPDQIVENESVERFARSLLADLPEKEAQILKCIYGIGLESPQSLREVGEYFDISHERVRQIRNQAQHRLKKLKIKNILKEKFSGKLSVAAISNIY